MAKKSTNVLSYLYLVGMILVVLGCFVPLFSHFAGNVNGATAISFLQKGNATIKVSVILTLVGAVLGGVICVLPCFTKINGAYLYKLVAFVASLAGSLCVFFNMNGKAIKFAAKISASHFAAGFYLIIAGYILALIGILKSKK